jgi:hypothetical protein
MGHSERKFLLAHLLDDKACFIIRKISEPCGDLKKGFFLILWRANWAKLGLGAVSSRKGKQTEVLHEKPFRRTNVCCH